jgi:hypothetical protein
MAALVAPIGVHAQTLYGPGGLFIHPTAFTPPAQSLTASASWFSQQIPGKRATEWVPLGLSYGITSRLEVGAMYVDRLAAKDLRRGSGGLFLRGQLMRETRSQPAVALSASYLGSDVKLASVAASAGYHVRSGGHTLLVAHGGLQWGWRGDGVPPADSLSVFVGAEAPVRYGISALAEYGTRFSFDYKESSALGLMWRSKHGFSVAAGYVNVGRSSANRFFIGVGVPIGGNQ